MNEWVVFGLVAVICGVLAALMRWGDDEGPDRVAEPRADDE